MKKEIFEKRQLIHFILLWGAMNLLLNLLGIGLNALISQFEYPLDLSDLSYALEGPIQQAVLFAIVVSITYGLTKKKSISIYSYTLLQCIILHLIFVLYLENEERVRFAASYSDVGVLYLNLNLQNLIFILINFKPFEGTFSCGIFSPADTTYFYFLYILMTLLYYLMITYLTDQIIKRQPTLNTDDNPGTNAQTSA